MQAIEKSNHKVHDKNSPSLRYGLRHGAFPGKDSRALIPVQCWTRRWDSLKHATRTLLVFEARSFSSACIKPIASHPLRADSQLGGAIYCSQTRGSTNRNSPVETVCLGCAGHIEELSLDWCACILRQPKLEPTISKLFRRTKELPYETALMRAESSILHCFV
jgi:hypothetical protein